MARSYVVDTHALVWYLEGSPRLGDAARRALEDPDSRLVLPLIALAEACWIVEHGRTRIPAVADLLADVDADPRIAVLPLDRRTLDLSIALTAIPEMHDRLIVAAALAISDPDEEAGILSRDETITASSPLPVIW